MSEPKSSQTGQAKRSNSLHQTKKKCPVCIERLNVPVTVTCVNGHATCSKCFLRVKTCSKCQLPLTMSKNLLLDEFIENTIFPCTNASYRYTEEKKYNEIILHEKDMCYFQNIQCGVSLTCKKDINLQTELGRMVTNLGLPLLIVNGKFQSLNKMTVRELETFIPFLVRCSVDRAGAHLVKGVPEWWTSIIQFKFPLKKPNGLSQTGYRRHLSSIVCRCYWYHDAQFLLPFCAQIANTPESVFLKNNEDNTTSIFYVKNTIHILTFNNENRDYDMAPEKKDRSVRRCLLPTLPNKATTPVITDVYLCENCDAEFSSHSDMQQHEKECYGTMAEEDKDSSEEIEVLSHIKPVVDCPSDQHGFLSYFKLGPKSSQSQSTPSKSRKNSVETPSKRWVSVDMCLHKNRSVEFSSFSGKKMLEHRARRDLMIRVDKTFAITESYCHTRSNREVKEFCEAKVTFRKPKRMQWSHQYCFNKRQRIDRYRTLKTGKTCSKTGKKKGKKRASSSFA